MVGTVCPIFLFCFGSTFQFPWIQFSPLIQEDPDHIGLIPRAIVHIFEGKEAEEDDDTLFDVRVSYIEIYNEEIRDLLGEDVTKKLEIKVN